MLLPLAPALLLALPALLLPDPTGAVRAPRREAPRRDGERPGERREQALGVLGTAFGAAGELVGRGALLEGGAAGVAAEVIEGHQRLRAPRSASSSLG